MNLDMINKIMKKKWKEMEEKENKENPKEEGAKKLKDIIYGLGAIEDFYEELFYVLNEMEEKDLDEEDEGSMVINVYEKWSYIFSTILNLDVRNLSTLASVFNTVVEIASEAEIDEE